jgi:hypothetical protein
LLSGLSNYAYNSSPALSADAKQLVFDCGNRPYGGEGTAICEASIDGQQFRVVLTPDDVPTGFTAGTALHHPDYGLNGSIVFEADWNHDERIWMLDSANNEPTLINGNFHNDNSPCALANGRVVSLWLGRPENTRSYHEIKLMNADGTNNTMALMGQDVADVVLGCGG